MRTLFCYWCICLLNGTVTAQETFHSNPARVKLITEDIPRFWAMMDRLPGATTKTDSILVIKTHYLDQASLGLKQLMVKKNYAFTAEDMYYTIRAYANYLHSIRSSSLQIAAYKNKIRDAFALLRKIYPPARFPDFYFAMGVFNSGGTRVPAGMFIGAEIESADSSSPLDKLPVYLQTGVKTVDKIHLICSHELIHFQQKDQVHDLLGAAIHEGLCDFIGELISGGLINAYQVQYGDQHEQELWTAFTQEMNGTDYSNWLYNGSRAKKYPADMGYYIGYKIAGAYYQQAADKTAALGELLNFSDAHAILEKSGYEKKLANRSAPVKINSYRIDMKVMPEEKTIDFTAKLSLSANQPLADTIRLLLHKNALITSVRLQGKPVSYLLEQGDQPANRYMPESRQLLIYPAGKIIGEVDLEMHYTTMFSALAQNNSHFSPEWISLASYSSWYPVNYDWGDFTYQLAISLPAGYHISGIGTQIFRDGRYFVTQTKPVSDIVFIASKRLQTKNFEENKTHIRLDYIDYTDAKADSIINGSINAYRYFSEQFGAIDSAAITIAATPMYGNSAFSRTNFIYLQTRGQTSLATAKTIGHEIAHFWWNQGQDTWEDWLSESFAEFSTLLFIRKYISAEDFDRLLREYQQQTKGLGPIWGLKRSANDASLILYYKGSLVLNDFMHFIGEDAFQKWTTKIHQQKIKNTNDLVSLTNTFLSEKAGSYLTELLKK